MFGSNKIYPVELKDPNTHTNTATTRNQLDLPFFDQVVSITSAFISLTFDLLSLGMDPLFTLLGVTTEAKHPAEGQLLLNIINLWGLAVL